MRLTRSNGRIRALVAIVLAVSLAATACGGDDGAAKGSRAKRAIQANAQQRAESMVLELPDFPNGWRASPPEQEAAGAENFRMCLGADYSALTIIGEANSDFELASTQASSTATVFADEGQPEDAIGKLADGMGSGAAADCFRDLIEEANGLTEVDDVDVAELGLTTPSGIAETKAWQIAISFHLKSGPEARAYLQFVTLREGDSLATVQTSNLLRPFDPELRDRLVEALAGRLPEPVF
jgi:hypothetical protein